MKAVFLQGYGDISQLFYGDVPDPVPSDDEVLVKVAGTSVNPSDWKIRQGLFKDFFPLQFPAVLGSDASGEVIAVGAKVSQFKPGDKVLAYVRKSHAELVAAKAEQLALMPEGMAFDQAAIIPLVTLTGTQLMEGGVQPRAGEVVIVTGALGLVGRTAAYIARVHGAIVIAAVRASQRQQAHALRVDKVIALDDDKDIASLPEIDAIVDTVGGEAVTKLLPKLKKSARLASVVAPSSAAAKAGFAMKMVQAQPDSKRLGQLAASVQAGDLIIPIGARFKLSEIREAMTAAESGKSGKILLIP